MQVLCFLMASPRGGSQMVKNSVKTKAVDGALIALYEKQYRVELKHFH